MRGLGIDAGHIYILFIISRAAVLARGFASYCSTCLGGTFVLLFYDVLNLLLPGMYCYCCTHGLCGAIWLYI
jgi:hypothetical protein